MNKSKSGGRVGKIIVGVVGAFIILGLMGAILNSGEEANKSYDAASTPKSTDTPTQTTVSQPNKEKTTISNTTIKATSYGMTEIVGEITNNDTVKHSATIKATFYDANKKIIGTAAGAINDVESGATKTFTLMTTDDISSQASYKVEVDTLL